MKRHLLLAILLLATFPFSSIAKEKTKTATPYPLEICFISYDKLSEAEEMITFTHKGQELKVCCRDCKEEFDKNQAENLKEFHKLRRQKKNK